MTEIRYVRQEDQAFWFRLDAHLSHTEFEKKVMERRGYVLLEEGKPVALLRYNLFWDSIPFCNLLFVEPEHQRQGHGRRLMEWWEADVRAQGWSMTLTSTRADEEAQHFYRKLGYRDCGSLLLSAPAYAQPTELFFAKELKK